MSDRDAVLRSLLDERTVDIVTTGRRSNRPRTTEIWTTVVDGQIHGGLTEGLAVAMGQELPYDAQGNVLGGTLMDYFVPTAVETPVWETDFTVTPSPHHPIGAKGVAESPHVGS